MANESLTSRSPLLILAAWNILMSLLLLAQLATRKYVISGEGTSMVTLAGRW